MKYTDTGRVVVGCRRRGRQVAIQATMIKALRDIMDGEMVIVGGQAHTGHVMLSPRQLATLELVVAGVAE